MGEHNTHTVLSPLKKLTRNLFEHKMRSAMIFRYVHTAMLVLKLVWEGRGSLAVEDAGQSQEGIVGAPQA